MNPSAVRVACALLVLVVPLRALPESSLVTGANASASASVRLRIVVPPMTRVLDNRHPANLWAAGGAPEAQQELVVQTTMRQGFCARLRLTSDEVREWTVKARAPNVSVQRTGDGYRVCAPRHGRYTLALHHEFALRTPLDQRAPMPWPVQTELSAL
jgi:hypothetical protein